MFWHAPPSPEPEECLAWDEAFLDDVEGGGPEALWFWEASRPFVALGYGQKAAVEADLDACRSSGAPVLRRLSGGGAVVQGPGCLSYGVALRIDPAGPLATVSGANRWIMERLAAALAPLTSLPLAVRGATDLAIVTPAGDFKVSGNAQRRRQRALMFHGGILLNFNLLWLGRCLKHPSSEPAYRRGRSHSEFVTNLGVEAGAVRSAIQAVWGAFTPHPTPPEVGMVEAYKRRYSLESWNLRR